MKTYTITLSDDHVSAIDKRILAMGGMYDSVTNTTKPMYADDCEYIAGVLKIDMQQLASFVPTVVAADKVIQDAQARRQASLVTIQNAVTVKEAA